MTSLAAVSVPSSRVPLELVERLAYSRDELPAALDFLRARTGAAQLLLLSTCERVELYGAWCGGDADASGLVEALLDHRGLEATEVVPVVSTYTGPDAARHLLRVASGLESFVLGETDVVGQVKAAGEASRSSGAMGLELERLVASATTTSRRVHRLTSLGRSGGSVADAAVRTAVARRGSLKGARVVVVGAGQVAGGVVAHATSLRADVTVCNRTRRHADRFRAAGARVVDLADLDAELHDADVAIFGTAAPHRLLGASQLGSARTGVDTELLVLDLCVPRNVDPEAGAVPGVRLVDLSEVRHVDARPGGLLAGDVAVAEDLVEDGVARYLRWVADRSAVEAVRRLRGDVEACARAEAARSTRGLPPELQDLVEQAVQRVTRRLAHQPTRRLVDAVVRGDDELANVLAGLFEVQEGA